MKVKMIVMVLKTPVYVTTPINSAHTEVSSYQSTTQADKLLDFPLSLVMRKPFFFAYAKTKMRG